MKYFWNVIIISLISSLLLLSGCYWQPETDGTGSVTINLGNSKDLPADLTGTGFRVEVWQASAMIEYYFEGRGYYSVDSFSSTPVYIYEDPTSPWTPDPNLAGSGTIIISDLEATVPYKIRFLVYYYNNGELWFGDPNVYPVSSGTLTNAWWGGLSNEFSITEGTDTAVDITLDYYDSSGIETNEYMPVW